MSANISIFNNEFGKRQNFSHPLLKGPSHHFIIMSKTFKRNFDHIDGNWPSHIYLNTSNGCIL